MLKALILDFDGVIVDSEPLHYREFLRVAQERGVRFSYDDYLEKYIGFDDRDGFRAILGEHGQSNNDAVIAHMVSAKAEAFEAVVADGVATIPGIEAIIAEAGAVQLPIAIASGATRRDIDLILDRLGLAQRFDAIVSADLVARSKPHPASYILAVDSLADRYPDLGLRPQDCLAIEDTAAGIDSANGAGVMTLGLASTGPAEKLARARRVVATLQGVGLDQLHEWFDEL